MQKKIEDCTNEELTQIGYNAFEELLALQQRIPQVEQILGGIRELKQQRAALAEAEAEAAEAEAAEAAKTNKKPIPMKKAKHG